VIRSLKVGVGEQKEKLLQLALEKKSLKTKEGQQGNVAHLEKVIREELHGIGIHHTDIGALLRRLRSQPVNPSDNHR